MAKSEELLRKYKSFKENKNGENNGKVSVVPGVKWFIPADPALSLQQLATIKDIRSIEVNLSNESSINSVTVASSLHSKTLKHVSIDFSGLGIAYMPSGNGVQSKGYESEVFMSSRKILGNLEGLQLESLQLQCCPNLPEFCRDLGKLDVSQLKYFNISYSNMDPYPSFQGDIYNFISKCPSIKYFNFAGVSLSPVLVRDIIIAKPYIHLPPSTPDPEGAVADMRSGQLIEMIDKSMNAPLVVIAMVLDYLSPNIQVELIGGIDASFEGMNYGHAVEQVLAI